MEADSLRDAQQGERQQIHLQYGKLHQKTILTIRVVQNKNRSALEKNKTQLDKAMGKTQTIWNKIQTIWNCPEWGFGQEGFWRLLPI